METYDDAIAGLALQAAAQSPDPLRSERNITRIMEQLSGRIPPMELMQHMKLLARLAACSQFLSNHCARRPEDLVWALERLDRPPARDEIMDEVMDGLVEMGAGEAGRRLRLMRKRFMLLITMRDLSGRADEVTSMQELSELAEALIEAAMRWASALCVRRYGTLPGGVSCVAIALGKLGGVEINYSSDVDLMFVYRDTDAQSNGVMGLNNVLQNRLGAHEFYIKAVESAVQLLHKNTEEGQVYRVDLRLRPQGQKGEIAMPLGAYAEYYESWGRTWERMMLIRARPVAGDMALGADFMRRIEQYVWHKSVDYAEIEDIRSLKKKIDSTMARDDIKRGYGGIREAEFFVQAFQMLYGPEARSLRTFRLLNAIQVLRRMGMIPEDELSGLWDSYLYLRRLEHFLQMQDDLQTYKLPSTEAEMEALARKMGHRDSAEFSRKLRLRRMRIKDMYNGLLGTKEDLLGEALTLLEGDLAQEELEGYLEFKGVRDIGACMKTMARLRENVASAKSQSLRAVSRRALPQLLDMALRGHAPDRALMALESFIGAYGMKEAYLASVVDRKEFAEGLVGVFSHSSLLARTMLGSPDYLNRLVESMPIRKTLRTMLREAGASAAEPIADGAAGLAERLAVYRVSEWLRLGMFFLSGVMDIHDLQRSLSHLAEAVLVEAVGAEAPRGFAVIAMGKLGGREITFGSDLDLMFVACDEEGRRAAERVIKVITTYTPRGALYEIDARLRPDGSKGTLVKDIAGLRDYYMRDSQGWEMQALLRARPVAGDHEAADAFHCMSREALIARGSIHTMADVSAMRQRIMKELLREDKGLDIKLGPGGLEEIEFFVQAMQLSNAKVHPHALVQNTRAAARRLARAGAISADDASTMEGIYDYYRRAETCMKLNGLSHLGAEDDAAHAIAQFMGHKNADEMLECIKGHRAVVRRITKL